MLLIVRWCCDKEVLHKLFNNILVFIFYVFHTVNLFTFPCIFLSFVIFSAPTYQDKHLMWINLFIDIWIKPLKSVHVVVVYMYSIVVVVVVVSGEHLTEIHSTFMCAP